MNFLKSLFKKKDEAVHSYEDFWGWFRKNEKTFFDVVKNDGDLEREFFDKLSPKLDELKDGFWYLTGMYDEDTIELIITADGNIRNIVFVEELVGAAPKMEGWKFTALKPALDIENVYIETYGYTFNQTNISFYSNDHTEFPDEIDITIVHNDCSEENRDAISSGVHLFLDNYLGELEFASTIDSLKIVGKGEVEKELIPIEKLKEFLNWRKMEFIEKYDGMKHNTGNDNHSVLKAKLNSGKPLVAVINTDLLAWDSKASHPWILTVEIKYDGESNNGMPEKQTSQLLDEIQDMIMDELKDFEGYLNIGRQTADSVREVYFACKDFRKPSKVLHKVQCEYADRIEVTYDIYKDKYWQSFNRFCPEPFDGYSN